MTLNEQVKSAAGRALRAFGRTSSRVVRWLRNTVAAAMLALAMFLAGCSTPTQVMQEVTATEQALCGLWGGNLPTRSRQDTAQTQVEIGIAYDAFEVGCGIPVWVPE